MRISDWSSDVCSSDLDFLVIARCEALIAGLGEAEALARSAAYEAAGADMILIHSKQKTPDEVESYVRAWTGKVPIVVVPTAYPEFTVDRMRALGKIAVAIWGNHAIPPAVPALHAVFQQNPAHAGIHAASRKILDVQELLRLQPIPRVTTPQKTLMT